MREWDNELDDAQTLEAFTLGGGLAKNAQPAIAGDDAKLKVRQESLRRSTPISRRKSKSYTSLPRRGTQQKNASMQKSLTAGAIRITEADATENSSAKKGGWLDGLKASRDFPALLRHAMHIAPPGLPPVGTVDAKSGVPGIKLPGTAQATERNQHAEQIQNEERNEPTYAIRIVLPVRSALRLKAIVQSLTSAWNWTQQQLKSRQTRKRLRVCESVSLGEKRFVAVIEVDGKQFLLGGSPTSVTTIARLDPAQKISDALDPGWIQNQVQA